MYRIKPYRGGEGGGQSLTISVPNVIYAVRIDNLPINLTYWFITLKCYKSSLLSVTSVIGKVI